MAGDYIPVRTDLREDPRVMRIAGEFDWPVTQVVGMLVVFWSWASRHTADGVLDGDAVLIDALVGEEDFSKALFAVGWLELTDDGRARIPRFETWLSASAKARERATRRKRLQRLRESAGTEVTYSRDGNGTKPKERKGKKKDPPKSSHGWEDLECLESLQGGGTAAEFHDRAQLALESIGFQVQRFAVIPDRGDGLRGRLHLLIQRGSGDRLAIELDNAAPRGKSISKVKAALDAGIADWGVVLLRDAKTTGKSVDGRLVVIGLQGPGTGRARRSRAQKDEEEAAAWVENQTKTPDASS